MLRTLFATLLIATAVTARADGSVTYSVNGADYEGYFADAPDDRGLVVLIHDWDGLTDYEVERAGMLKALGYDVFAIDLFGKGIRPTEMADRRQHTGELYQDRAKMRALMEGGIAAAAEQGAAADNAVAMGYCFGGAAVLELARSGAPLKGFVTFHGGLGTPEGQDYSAVKGRIEVHHGTADTAITMAEFAALADQLEAAGVDHAMTTYGGAPHAFTVFGSDRYRPEADEASWAHFTGFLGNTL